jgi:hypothetical protein
LLLFLFRRRLWHLLFFHPPPSPPEFVLPIVCSALHYLVTLSSPRHLVVALLQILPGFWGASLSRLAIWILAGIVLECLRLLVHFFLTLLRSTRLLLLLEQLIILSVLVESSKLIWLILPGRFSNLFVHQKYLLLSLILEIFRLTLNILEILTLSHVS